MKLKELYEFYESTLDSNGFYNCLAQKIKDNPGLYNERLLIESPTTSDVKKNNLNIIVKKGDSRFDMPLAIGNSSAKERILILGLEPRHTDDFFNLMRVGNKVFATPFGIDRWYASSGKRNYYGTAFADFFNTNRVFLFSDFVKEYKVSDPNDKKQNSEDARNNFKNLFDHSYKSILEKEISIFKPALIVGLGKTDILKKVDKSFLEENSINVISHPVHGNINRMKLAMHKLLNNE